MAKSKQVATKIWQVHSNPYPLITAGRSLNDKDRNINADLREIHDFFKPIDNLFGDYEVRKKFGLDEMLYRKKFFDQKMHWKDKTDNNFSKLKKKPDDFKLKIEEDDRKVGILFVFFVIYDFEENDVFLDYFILDSNSIFSDLDMITKQIKDKISESAKIIQTFIIDPEKLIQILDLDSARHQSFKDIILNKREGLLNLYGLADSRKEKCLDIVIDVLINKIKTIKSKNTSMKRYFSVSDIGLNPNLYNEIIGEIKTHGSLTKQKDLIDTELRCCIKFVELFVNKAHKLKNFERHSYFRARIGYTDNHYVLFLHPYESESNNPIGFPPS